jgi:hypothetical protein
VFLERGASWYTARTMPAFTLGNAGIFATALPEMWDMTKTILLDDLLDRLKNHGGCFRYAALLSDQGFLVYAEIIYPAMRSCLKGFKMTIDRW